MVSAAGRASRILSFLNEVKTGNVVNGRYLIEEQLGSGGMGIVYAARHVQLGIKVAIKVLLPELLSDPEAIERFDREARAAAKIADENVVRILDVGQLQSGAPYMVMEFLEGQDAAIYLKEHGRLSIEHAIDVLLQACSAVAAAHAMHIIHRDIKPSNLFFVPRSAGRPLVKVLDFGVSKFLSAGSPESPQVTKTGSILGSPGYVPPEQWFSSKAADKRSDIWALGLVLYEFLTGRLPFDEASIPVLATKIAYEPARPPRHLREEIPVDLEQVVLRCLEKSPDDRFQDVMALAKALKESQSSYQALDRSSANHPIRLSMPGVERLRGPFPFSMRAGAAALVVLVTVVGLGALLHRRGSPVAGPRQNPAPEIPQQTPSTVLLVSPVPPAGGPSVAAASPPSSLPVARPKAAVAQRHPARTGVGRARPASDGQRHPEGGADTNAARCQPPYFFNAKGIRVFKIECL